MVVYILDTAPENLRGELTKWILEVKPGVFVGNISKTVRDKLWEKIQNCFIAGGLMVYTVASEQGYHFEMFGSPRRAIVDFNGVELVEIKKEK